MTNTNIREFLTRVLPWPSDDEPGFINLHAQGTGSEGNKFWTGYPTRDVDQFLKLTQEALRWRIPPDIYMCMSRQSETRQGKDGKVRAAKSQEHALALKSIFLDIDIKPNGYTSLLDAVAALTKFGTDATIPPPTGLVVSGGGLHAYWVSENILAPQDWQLYADGLKQATMTFGLSCDLGVTGDSARVLRVPGTWNYKLSTPRAVSLLGMQEKDYDFAKDLKALLRFSGQAISGKVHTPILPGTPSTRFVSLPRESLSLGLERDELPPLDPEPMVKVCKHFQEALTTGGKGFSQGLWNLTTLAATFLENGDALAHKMASGHSGYIRNETDALWERKNAERKSMGLGWPSCRAIQAEGCTHCATCPILAQNKSPLHFARVPTLPIPMVPQGAISPHVAPSKMGKTFWPVVVSDLPPNHTIIDEIIHRQVTVKVKGNAPSTENRPLFHSRLYNPWIQSGPEALNFVTSLSKGDYNEVCIPKTDMTSMTIETALLRGGVIPVSPNLPYVKDFITSWHAKLQDAAKAHANEPFGWHWEEDECVGFSYGSVLYKSDGTRGPIGLMDPALKKTYTPMGREEIWHQAFDLIASQNRMGLQVIIASSFGAPLMMFTGFYNVTMAVYGNTGAMKSSAARVACAVWGSPILMKESEHATQKAVIDKLGQIRNLPFYWDEIKDEAAQRKAYNAIYLQGATYDKMRSNSTHFEKKTFNTICGLFSNRVFSSFVIKENPDTEAGLVRLVEWQEDRPVLASAPGLVRESDAERVYMALDKNFGQVGKKYAEFIGPNQELCRAEVKKNQDYFEDVMKDTIYNNSDERFWPAFAAAVQTGAELARSQLGIAFDINGMREFLVWLIREQRKRNKNENLKSGDFDHTEGLLTGFLKACSKSTVTTKVTSLRRAGRPTQAPIEMEPTVAPIEFCHVQWAKDVPELRISKVALKQWLEGVKGDIRLFSEALKRHFQAHEQKLTLAAGLQGIAKGPEKCYVMPVKHPTLVGMMNHGVAANVTHTNQDSIQKVGSPMEQQECS